MSKPVKVTIFDNGNVAVWDKDGQQVSSLQGAFYDYRYMNKLAKAIADKDLAVEGNAPIDCDFYQRLEMFRRLKGAKA